MQPMSERGDSGRPRQDLRVPADVGWDSIGKLRRGFWRRTMPPSAWVVLAICVVASVYRTWVLAGDPDGDLGLQGFVLLLFVGVPVTSWAVLASLWGPDRDLGTLKLAGARAVLVPLITELTLVVTTLVVRFAPPMRGRIQDNTHADWYHPHYWLSPEGQSPMAAQTIHTLGGVAMGMVAGLLVLAFVVLPLGAIFHPYRTIVDLDLDTSPVKRRNNRVAVLGIAVVVPLALIISVLWVLADRGHVPWWPVGICFGMLGVLLLATWRIQRVDHAKRARMGPLIRGVPNPDDPPPGDQ